jgi:uncharacterized membrane protein YedE/YeeE
MLTTYVWALVGGCLIGIAAGILLLFNGKIFGVSGIVGGLLTPVRGETSWKLAATAGLIVGGVVMGLMGVDVFTTVPPPSMLLLIASGLLVGFGSRLGNGCTSGHGVCGIGRFSPRSMAATVTFMGAGVLAVVLINSLS